MAVAVKPSNSLINIRSSIKSVRSAFSGLKKKTGNLNNILLRKTKVKRESIARNYILSQRRDEGERRKNREDLIEASSIGGVIKRQAKAVASSTKGFLGRIMDFLGTLLVGWLLYNLPSIITMAQELIARMQRLSTIVTGFFSKTTSIFTGFGNVLGAIGTNILTFDFTDSKRRVKNAMSDLGSTFDDMQSQFDEGFRLLTTSLGEGVASGKDSKPFGTQYPNESMQEPSATPTPSGGGFSGTGVSKGTQISKRLQKDLGLKDYQAAAVVGNLLQENTNLVPDLLEGSKKGLLTDAMRKGIGYGWAQWTDPGRQKKLYQLAQSMGVDPSKQPLTDEINYAMLVRELLGYDSGGRFRNSKNIEEASNWILFNYENPDDKGRGEQSQRIEDSRKILKGMGTQTQSAPTPPPAPIQSGKKLKGGEILTKSLGKGVQYVQITSGYGSRGGGHMGLDIAAPEGTYIALRYDCEVVAAGTYGNYGNLMDVWIPQLGIQLRMGHLSAILIKSGKIKAGTSFARVGSTGRSTGPHIHLEYSTKRNSTNYGGSGDPSPYVSVLLLTKNPNQGSFGIPSQAQITPQGTQQRQQVSQQLGQQRNGPTVVVIEEDAPPQPQVSAGGGGGGIIPIIINPLNSFITKKLLLDLAYT
jgi:murein DD-endopeptidase MepM/ murein hydrolase activator NlpD